MKKVLVVEDDEEIREVLKSVLLSEGYKVDAQPGALEAVEWLKNAKGRPDLILLDLMMPKMNGYEFIKNIRKNDQYKDLPIIVLTAARNAPQPEGVSEYVKKPIDLDILLSLIARHAA